MATPTKTQTKKQIAASEKKARAAAKSAAAELTASETALESLKPVTAAQLPSNQLSADKRDIATLCALNAESSLIVRHHSAERQIALYRRNDVPSPSTRLFSAEHLGASTGRLVFGDFLLAAIAAKCEALVDGVTVANGDNVKRGSPGRQWIIGRTDATGEALVPIHQFGG